MALSIETLRAEQGLTGLTDEQITTIVALSQADEDTVVGTRIGEIHSSYEQDILKLTGIAKNQNEKAYDYNKRVLSTYKNNVAKLTTDMTTLKTEKETLEKQIKDGSTDEAVKTQLATVTQQLSDLKNELNQKTEYITKLETEHKSALMQAKVDFQFEVANKAIKFKSGYSDSIANILLQQAKNEIMNKFVPDFVEDDKGNNTLVFRNKDTNEIARNPKNGLQPYTITELYDTTIIKDAIDKERKQPGGGTGPNNKRSSSEAAFDLSGAKTQTQADNIIYQYLMEKGITRGSMEFAAEQKKLRDENEVSKLPIR